MHLFAEKAVQNKKIVFYTRDMWLEFSEVWICVVNMFKVKSKEITPEVPLVTFNANAEESPHIILVS